MDDQGELLLGKIVQSLKLEDSERGYLEKQLQALFNGKRRVVQAMVELVLFTPGAGGIRRNRLEEVLRTLGVGIGYSNLDTLAATIAEENGHPEWVSNIPTLHSVPTVILNMGPGVQKKFSGKREFDYISYHPDLAGLIIRHLLRKKVEDDKRKEKMFTVDDLYTRIDELYGPKGLRVFREVFTPPKLREKLLSMTEMTSGEESAVSM